VFTNLVPAGGVLMPSLVSTLRFQCWVVLKVDNAWAMAASDFVNNVMDVTGCAVVFGSVYAWWQRGMIERVNLELVRRGMHKLVSTYGSGPNDPKRVAPEKNAMKYKISLDDLHAIFLTAVNDHNTVTRGEANFGRTRKEIFEYFTGHPGSGFAAQPLPDPAGSMNLLWHTEVVKIRGNAKTGIRPYAEKIGRRYANKYLANRFSLIGKDLILRINRANVAEARGILFDEKRDIGMLSVTARWKKRILTWQVASLIQRDVNRSPALRGGPDSVTDFMKGKRAALRASRQGAPQHPTKDGLVLQKAGDLESREPATVAASECEKDSNSTWGNGFGILGDMGKP
jgi:hypothetical protein